MIYCSFRHSQLYSEDKVCSRCGGPTLNAIHVDSEDDEEENVYSSFIREIESTEPAQFIGSSILLDSENILTYFHKYFNNSLLHFAGERK